MTQFVGPSYVEYLWDKYLNGWNDAECENSDPLFMVLPEDIQAQPELSGKQAVRLHGSETGLVYEVDVDTGNPPEKAQIDLRNVRVTQKQRQGFKDGYSKIPPTEIEIEYMRGYMEGLEQRERDG